jgi:hypothetical protein
VAKLIPRNAPTKTSIRKCCARYILEYPTKAAAMNIIMLNNLLLKCRANTVANANAEVVCPEGKLFEPL